jgi:predicted esterase YcpF (UPF0227 family)
MRLLYLHGFRSSPQSAKAMTMLWHVLAYNASVPVAQRIQWHCPQLPPSPRQAMAKIMRWVRSVDAAQPLAVIGSSLGGYYAAQVAERTGARCVLLNPAVYPARDLKAFIGRVKTGMTRAAMHSHSSTWMNCKHWKIAVLPNRSGTQPSSARVTKC